MRPLQTTTRWAKLVDVFPTQHIELNSLLVALCVLYEDLRIEISGIEANDIEALDECGKAGRRLYFQRRSFATLHEFGEVLREVDAVPEFHAAVDQWNELAKRHWRAALRYFRRHKKDLERIRHHAGGHFKSQAGKQVVKNTGADVVGSMEICTYDRGIGSKLLFAADLAATVVLQNTRGKNLAEKAKRMTKTSLVGYNHAVRAVHCIIVVDLWDRFGK